MISQFKEISIIRNRVKDFHQRFLLLKTKQEKNSEDLVRSDSLSQKRYEQALKKAENISSMYVEKVDEDFYYLSLLDDMIAALPSKYVEKYVPHNQVCPSCLDFARLQEHYQMVVDDTFESAMKRQFHIEGYYDWKQMTFDFLDETNEARIFLQKHIADLYQEGANQTQKVKNDSETEKQLSALAQSNQAKKQAADLQTAVDKLSGERIAFLNDDLIQKFDQRVILDAVDTGFSEKDWACYNADRKISPFIYAGICEVQCDMPSVSLGSELEKNISCFCALEKGVKGSFTVPFFLENRLNYRLFYHFSEQTKEMVCNDIQTLVLNKLRSFPTQRVKVSFFDPLGRGSSAGLFLASIEDNALIGVSMCNSKEDIQKALDSLSKEMDENLIHIGNSTTVKEFNQTHSVPVSEHVMVVFDFPGSFSSDMVEELSTIIRNSDKCGMDIIVVSDYASNQLSQSEDYPRIDWSVFTSFPWICFEATEKKKWVLHLGPGQYYNYFPRENGSYLSRFMKLYRQQYQESLKIHNSYSDVFDKKVEMTFRDGTEGIYLPILLPKGKRGDLFNLPIGTDANTHTLITGATRSGKSSLLHIIICSILRDYHPDDVELWLIDYGKVEFNLYTKNRPASVRFIATENSEEFTFSFLEYVHSFFEARKLMFEKEGVTKLSQYRERKGKLSLPRVVLIVDEFHIMAQQVQNNLQYRNLLENMLRDYAKYGLACIFSDQTFSGLAGLTDSAKNQISNRIAMRNTLAEMKMTLGVQSGNYSEETLAAMERTEMGDVWYKTPFGSGNDFKIEEFKAIYLQSVEQEKLLAEISARKILPQQDTAVHQVTDSNRKCAPPEALKNSILKTLSENPKAIPFFPGSPVTLEKVFSFFVEKRYNQNILLTGSDENLKWDLMKTMLLNASFVHDSQVHVFADENDDMLERLEKWGNRPQTISIHKNIQDICHHISAISKKVANRENTDGHCFLFWLGFSDLIDEFNLLPPKKEDEETVSENLDIDPIELAKDAQLMEMAADIGLPIEELIGNLCSSERPRGTSNNENAYNACADSYSLFAAGGKFGVVSVLPIASSVSLKRARGFSLDWFIHRIGTLMSREESAYFGFKALASEVERNETAVYTDGIEIHRFRPYQIKESM